jgi:hypothetical protein
MISRGGPAWVIFGFFVLAAACHTHAATTGTASTVETGYSAAALYNAANAYARAGKPGLAVLNYERAALLAPDDADIDANLRFVRESSHVMPEPRWRIDRLIRLASPTMVGWLGAGGTVIIAAGFLAGLLAPRRRLTRVAALLTGALLTGFTASNAVLLWPKLHEAVVLSAATPARAAPVPMGDPLFLLPEAETVRITAEHDDFLLIRSRAGQTGWVSRANLAPVLPRR